MDPHFHRFMNTFDYEDALFRIDPNLQEFRDLKEKVCAVQFSQQQRSAFSKTGTVHADKRIQKLQA